MCVSSSTSPLAQRRHTLLNFVLILPILKISQSGDFMFRKNLHKRNIRFVIHTSVSKSVDN